MCYWNRSSNTYKFSRSLHFLIDNQTLSHVHVNCQTVRSLFDHTINTNLSLFCDRLNEIPVVFFKLFLMHRHNHSKTTKQAQLG